ncbi:MAG: PAS domain S-box protein [Candidatus Viridilinea halotolerans]|uniref:PAS domain S-box protein n=1 Tax=Candidatus Viridilinea halotolerans TaxID=2491704 RepID=A0A426TQV6_9CHLR|nr:MAG: PAS domain S-box protein [Candidatus Viridilinea halotolerans]
MDTAALQERIVQLETELAAAQQQISQLQRDQTLLQGIVEYMPAVLIVKNREGRFILLNRSAIEMGRLNAEQVIGLAESDVMPPEIAEVLQERDRKVIATGEIGYYEDMVMLEGQVHYFNSVRFPIRDSSGEIYATGNVGVNITERKRLEQENTLFRSIVQRSPIAIANVNIDTVSINYVNAAYCQLIGYSEAELLGMPITTVFGETPEFIMAAFEQCLAEGLWQGEIRYRHKDGHLITTLLLATTLYDEQGKALGVTGFVQDLTELKQQAGQLRLFQRLVENAADGIVISDLAGKVTYANRAYQTMLGATESLVGRDGAELLAPDEHQRMAGWITQASSNDNFIEQVTYRRLDGAIFPAQCSGLVIRDEAGQPISFASINRDMSEQLRTEQERQQMQEQIIMAQEAALRELSTPLMPIAEGVVVMPIIGSIDTARAQQVMETLLEGIAEHDAQLAILDITGVKVVDTQVAGALIRAAQAARLLGADVVLSGISPEIAQTLVHIGVELREIVAKGSLQNAIAYALARQE